MIASRAAGLGPSWARICADLLDRAEPPGPAPIGDDGPPDAVERALQRGNHAAGADGEEDDDRCRDDGVLDTVGQPRSRARIAM